MKIHDEIFIQLTISFYAIYRIIPLANWVGLRTGASRELRQVRKKAAAADAFRVAVSSSSVGILIFRLLYYRICHEPPHKI